MTTKNNDVLGYIECADCKTRATVHRTSRGKSRYLYKRCDCGCDQRTGAAVQTWLFNNTQWIGVVPDAPPNLLTTEKQPETTEKKAVMELDFEPEDVAAKKEEQPKASPFGLIATIGLGLGMAMLSMAGVKR